MTDTAAAAHAHAHAGWSRLLRSFFALAGGEGAARLIGLVSTLILARELGPAGFGLITLGITLVGWFALIVDSGTEALNVRDVSRQPNRFREIADHVLGLRLVLSLVAMAAFATGALLFARSDLSREVLLPFALVMPALALNLRWMVLGIHQARAVAFGNIAARVVLLAGVLVVVTGPASVLDVPYLIALGELVYGLAIIAVISRRVGLVRPRVSLESWRKTLRESLPLMMWGVARVGVVSSDILLIDLMLGPRQLGIYSAAQRPMLFAGGLVGLFSVSFLSALSASSRAAGAVLFRRTSRLLLAISFPAALVLSVTAPLIVPLLFGKRYEAGVEVLAILAWLLPITALSMPYTNALIAGERQMSLMWNNVAAAVVAVGANVLALSYIGIEGAAIVRLASGTLVLALNYRVAVRAGLAPNFAALVRRSPHEPAGS